MCWHVCRYENLRSFWGSTSLSSFTRLGAPSGTLTTFHSPAYNSWHLVSGVSAQGMRATHLWRRACASCPLNASKQSGNTYKQQNTRRSTY